MIREFVPEWAYYGTYGTFERAMAALEEGKAFYESQMFDYRYEWQITDSRTGQEIFHLDVVSAA